MPTHNDYQVGWICALPLEFAAAEAMLDTLHETLPNRRDDENTYVLGSIRQHNIVIACLPVGVYGTTSATSVGMQMRASFPSLRFCLLVGVAGGAPGPHADIRLGDVVVSKPTGGYGGVLQYDYGKAVDDGEFILTGMLDKPPAVLLTALARLQARHHLRANDIHRFYKEALDKYGQLAETFSFPGRADDVLFLSDYSHVEGGRADCDNCDQGQVHPRPPRSSTHPRVFYGLVASANQVLRSAVRRDALSRRHGILCFEMEAAGLIDVLPCLVVRGICDYCDSHKNKQWQGYASMTAAAYAKELLSVIPSNEVSETTTIKGGLSNTSNRLPITPSSSGQIKAPSPEAIDLGFDGPGSDNGHSIAVEDSSFRSRAAEILEYRVGRRSRLIIGIELGYEFSRAAWTITKGFTVGKFNLITSWPGAIRETHQVPTDVGYKDGEAFWGYDIPQGTSRVAFLHFLHSDDEDSVNGRSASELVYDYIFGFYFHIRHKIREKEMAPWGKREAQVVLVVPSALQSKAKDVESIAKGVFSRHGSLPNLNIVLRSKAVALGQLWILPKPPLGAYVICDMRAHSTHLTTYKLATVNPTVVQEIGDSMEEHGPGINVNEAIEDACVENLRNFRLHPVFMISRHLQQPVKTFAEDILKPCFGATSRTGKYSIDVREILLQEGLPDDYTYEPYMSKGHISLEESKIASILNDALYPVEKFIDAQLSSAKHQKIEGIILAGSWGSNPYVYKRFKRLYTKSDAIPVFQDRNTCLHALRGAICMGSVE